MGVPLLFRHAGAAPVAEVNSPSLWDGGVEWGDAETDGAKAYWQASPDPSPRTTRPRISVAIAGRRMAAQTASWTLGHDDWFGILQPCTANFGFVGPVDAMPNDPIVVAVESEATAEHSDVLWVGRIDTVTMTKQTDGSYWSSVTAVDPIAILGQAAAPLTGGVPDGDLQSLTRRIAKEAGLRLTVDSADSLPPIYGAFYADGTGGTNSTVLDLINRFEHTSNALLMQQRDGSLRASVRKAFGGTVETVPLEGLDSPSSWVVQTDPTNVYNDFELGAVPFGSSGAWSERSYTDPTDSQKAYGKRTLSVTDIMAPSHAAYADILLSPVLAAPRPRVTSATFPISSLEQHALFLDPLDLVTFEDDIWQVMTVSHDVSGGGSDWTVTITADITQSLIAGDEDPPTTTDPDPTPGTRTITRTYTSAKSGVGYRSSGGAQYGNGADGYLSVGYYQGTRARSFIAHPTINWASDFPGFIRVKNATLDLRTSGQVRVAFGSHPKVYAQRITQAWTQGSTTYPNDANGGALTWPGPSRTSTGQTLRSLTRATDKDVSLNVTDIVQAEHDSGNQYGVALISANEASSSNTTEFYSDDHAHGPAFTITCVVTA